MTWRHGSLAPALCLGLACLICGNADADQAGRSRQPLSSKERTVQTNQAAIEALSRIQDARLLTANAGDAEDEAYNALRRVSFDGIALRVPSAVPRDRVDVPALVALSQSASRESQLPAGDNAVVVVNEVGGSKVWTAPLYRSNPAKIPDVQVPIPPTDPKTTAVPLGSVQVKPLGLRAAGALPAEEGTYAVRVFIYDWRSNTATVRVGAGMTAATAAAQGQLLARGATVARGTPDALPHFVRSSNSPALEGDGVAAVFPQRPVAAGGALPVYGTVRSATANTGPAGNLAAVEAVHVLLVRPGVQTPIVVTLRVPLYLEGKQAQGYFGYDLGRVARTPLPAGRYLAYVIAGTETAGPYALAIE